MHGNSLRIGFCTLALLVDIGEARILSLHVLQQLWLSFCSLLQQLGVSSFFVFFSSFIVSPPSIAIDFRLVFFFERYFPYGIIDGDPIVS